MKKYVIKDKFGFENLVQADAPDPEPAAGEVLIRVKAVSLNFRDLLMVQGLYNPNQPLPLTPLSDCSAEVVETGPGVTRFQKGDRVCSTFFRDWIKGEPTPEELRSTLGGPLDGTLAERMAVPERSLVHAPVNVSDEAAATLTCAGVTAWTALVTLGNVKAGDFVLVQGTGGVSVFAFQFAKMMGAKVIAMSSSSKKIGKLEEMGAFATFNYKDDPKWGKKVLDLTGGRGVDHVIDVGGAGTLEQSFIACRPRGRVSVIGVLAGIEASYNIRHILMAGLTVQGIFVGHRDSFEDMNRAIEANLLRPVVDRVFFFDEVVEAMKYMRDGKHFGKVVIRVA